MSDIIQSNKFEAFFGLIVLIVAASFIIHVINSQGQKSFNKNNLLIRAKFSNIDGIEIGSDIKLSGVKIGTVSEKSIDPNNYKAILSLSISNDIALPKDSSANVVSSGILGGKYIEIRPGSDDKYLGDGDSIIYTQSSVSLEDLIGKIAFSKKD